MKKNCCSGEAGVFTNVTGVRVGRVGEEEYVKSIVVLRENLACRRNKYGRIKHMVYIVFITVEESTHSVHCNHYHG